MYTLKFITRKPCEKYTFGLFRVQLMLGSKIKISKDAAIMSHSAKNAYAALEKQALEWIGIYTVTTFNKPTFKEMCDAFSEKPSASDTIAETFGHGGRFKSMIRAAYKKLGYERVMGMLGEGGILLDEIHSPIVKKQQAMADANVALAWTLYRITLNSGVCMLEKCIDDNVKRLYQGHFNQDGKIKTYYALDGERWDGLGNPPTTFKKWAQHTGEKSYDELLVKGCSHG
jgi:hypothetical protein